MLTNRFGNRYIETSLIWLISTSLLIHIIFLFLLLHYHPKQNVKEEEPVFVDLQNMPELKKIAPDKSKKASASDVQQRVKKEMAPKGDAHKDKNFTPTPEMNRARAQYSKASPQQKASPPTSAPPSSAASNLKQRGERYEVEAGSSASSLLRRGATDSRSASKPQPKLFPSASRLAKLEENYRRKFEKDIEEGTTKFLNSDDILFGSFLRRFENAVYGVWRYPMEAQVKGIEGVVPVRITFNRRGEITQVIKLESSGAKILDDEVSRTLNSVGPVGTFPKGYDKDEFHLIAFFQYGGARRSLR